MQLRTPEDSRFREQRRSALVRSGAVSGLDFVEAAPVPGSTDRFRLTLHFLAAPPRDLTVSNVAIRSPGGGLETDLSVDSLSMVSPRGDLHGLEHGAQRVELTVRCHDRERADRLARDPREYRLELPGVTIDPFFGSAFFRFDGEATGAAIVARAAAVDRDFGEVDYLAKDFDSFRRLMLDRMTVRVPEWSERNPADLGVAIVEVLAYAADYLSYYQDAVATEAYLDTARQRSSVRRHLRLLGYSLHEGNNARVWAQIQVESAPRGGELELPEGTRLLTRVAETPPTIAFPSHDYDAALAQGSLVFETMHAVSLRPEHNYLALYAWGARDYTLPEGAVSVALTDHYPHLAAGDVLIFEQVRSPGVAGLATSSAAGLATSSVAGLATSSVAGLATSGAAGDQAAESDLGRRHPARLAGPPRLRTDPLTGREITEIDLFEDDALPFSLTVAATTGEGSVDGLAVACGNVVLADHGTTVREELPEAPAHKGWRPELSRTELTRRVPYHADRARHCSAASALHQAPERALPALVLRQRSSGNGQSGAADSWRPLGDLLDSDRFARHLVVETESDGRARLRFGDDRLGRRPAAGTRLEAVYRVGNGPGGLIGPESLAHVVVQGSLPITKVRNPLASAGAEPREPLERARLVAPRAMRRRKVCVNAADGAELAMRHPDVLSATGRVAWTGSWSTLVVTVQRRNGRPLDDAFERDLRELLEPALLADRDLEIRPPVVLGLEVVLRGRLEKGSLRATVQRRLLEALGERTLADGGEGFFHPDRCRLGQVLYLGELLDAAMQVHGVALIEAETFRPCAAVPSGPRVHDRVEPGSDQMVSVRNLPSAPELGNLTVVLEDGS